MPARSLVSQLPPEIREELDRKLIAGAFSGYTGLAEWLAEQGHAISRSAVHAHGQTLESRIEKVRLATEHAQAFVAAVPDDEGAMADASLRLAQKELFDVLLAAEGGKPKDIIAATRAIAETSRAGTHVRNERRKARAAAVAEADKLLEKAEAAAENGDPMAAIRRVRQEIYGIVDEPGA